MAVAHQTTTGYLKLLFWLKWKLMLRGYRRNLSSVIGAVLAVSIFLPIAIGAAFVIGLGFDRLSSEWRPHLLRGVLLAIYLWWLVVPLLGYALNESYDLTKLFVYPLSVRQIFTGAILGSFLDFPLLFVLPTLFAVLIAFSKGVLGLAAVAIPLGLFLFHTFSLSQGIILASAGILRSRRFRDLAMLIIPIFWIGYYVATQSFSRGAVSIDWSKYLHSNTWTLVNYLPSGLAARAIEAAGEGSYLNSLGYLLALSAITAGTVYLAGWVIRKVFEGETFGFAARKPPSTGVTETKRPSAAGPDTGAKQGSTLLAHLPSAIQAVADKEFKYLVRDPYFRMTLMNLGYMLVVAVFMFIRPAGRSTFESYGPAMAWGASGMVLLSEMQMVCNIFGTEGGAASILFQFPASRRQIIMGKNLAFFTALSAVNVVFMLVIGSLAGALAMFGPLFLWMTLSLAVFIAIGNIVSIRFPLRIVMKGWRVKQQAAGRSCGFGFLYIGFFLAATGLLVPILIALLLPSFFIAGIWFALTVPIAIGYAVLLYYFSLRMGEPMLMGREIEMMEKLSAEE